MLVTGLGVLSLVTVMAKVHGMAAPFGYLLPMLFGGSSAPLAATPAEVRQRFAAGANPARRTTTIDATGIAEETIRMRHSPSERDERRGRAS